MTDDWTNYGGANETPWGPRLSSYHLHTQEWRQAFLERMVAVGEPALLEATARVYDLLEEPKEYRCALIAQGAGVTGSGKIAILNTLRAFLDEWLMQPALPSPGSMGALRDWHRAAMQVWTSEQGREKWVIWKFATALNGELPVTLAVTELGRRAASQSIFYRATNR